MADALWQWDELVRASGGAADGRPDAAISGFSIDTRAIMPGEVFVALKDQRDGHAFVPAAFKAGAAAALVAADYVRQPGDGALIRVDDTLRGLERIGAAARARLAGEARVIAVTGSAGKTGTKEMLRACLSRLGPTHAPDKSFNNHWGVPLTLARMPSGTRFGVFEIGMNHADEITPLTRLVRPHVAIVTNVLPVHVGNFPDGVVGVAKAKAEIFSGLVPGGTAVLNATNPECYEILAAEAHKWAARVKTFGKGQTASREFDARLVDARNRSDGDQTESIVTVNFKRQAPTAVIPAEAAARSAAAQRPEPEATTGAISPGSRLASGGRDDKHPFADRSVGQQPNEIVYVLGIPGAHIAENSMAVLLCLDTLSLLSDDAMKPLMELGPPEGRGRRSLLTAGSGSLLLIDEAYNANPASMTWAIIVAGQQLDLPRSDLNRRFQRCVIVIGDMLELGDQAKQLHRDLQSTIEQRADLVFACGPNMQHLFAMLPPERRGAWTPTSAELVAPVLAALRSGDVVMVKGSLGSRMAPIVAAIKERFARAG